MITDPKPVRRTYCKNGHPLEDAYVTRDGRRDCRECRRQRHREYKQRHRDRLRATRVRYDKKPREVACPDCGETRTVHGGPIGKRCKLCANKAATRRARRVCGYCEKDFIPPRLGIVHCSVECRRLSGAYEEMGVRQSAARRGKDNPAYRDGRYIGKSIAKWRLARKGEDACRNCGSREGVHLHHAIPRTKCRAVRAELLNGLPLCATCHFGWHQHRVVICRDVFTAEEWEFLLSVQLAGGERIEPWLDRRYPERSAVAA